MAHPEPGDSSNYPTNITVPDDGDDHDAASVVVALEGLADRTAYLQSKLFAAANIQTVNTSATVTAPTGAVAALLIGYGGGGGGGAGAGNAGADFRSTGAGGGGGAIETVRYVPITSGGDYDVVVGAGGVGGTGTSGAVGADGEDGEDTTFTRVSDSTLLATFKGASGGVGGITEGFGAGGDGVAVSPGGLTTTTFGYFIPDPDFGPWNPDLNVYMAPQRGGAGTTNNINNQVRAGSSPQGHLGGVGGSHGSPLQAGSYHAGGAGGGGGAGPGGGGGDGGNGGRPNNAGAAITAGVTNGPGHGSSALNSNSGAGGGGGGSAGASNVTGALGGNGGLGSKGKLTIVWLRGGV